MPTTCEWLFSQQSYRGWRHGEGSPCLWLLGIPGAGKSVLASRLLEDLETFYPSESLVISYFLDETFGSVEDSRAILLRTLLDQLNNRCPPKTSNLLLEAELMAIETVSDPLSVTTFQSLLRRILSSIEANVSVTFVLDGLDGDECIKMAVVHEILMANTSRSRVAHFRCCISSRTPCDVTLLKTCAVQIDLKEEIGFQHDLTTYTKHRLSEIPSEDFGKGPLRNIYINQLCVRARGSFLWLAIMLRSPLEVKKLVVSADGMRSTPSTIEELYQRILQNITREKIPFAWRLFSWLVAASRPLTLQELSQALAASRSCGRAWDPSPKSADIATMCGPLITVTDQGIVRFVHQSVREYLLSSGMRTWSVAPLNQAHQFLAQTCLNHLRNDLGANGQNLFRFEALRTLAYFEGIQKSNFTEYAVANWALHYKIGETGSNQLPGTLQEVLVFALGLLCRKLSLSCHERPRMIKQAALRFCSFHGFSRLLQMYLDMGTPLVDGLCEYCATPLELAVTQNQTAIVHLLLEKGAQAPAKRVSASVEMLSHAAAHGSVEVLEALLRHGAAVDSVARGSDMTPLHLAAYSGHIECARMLIDFGADIRAITSVAKETPLHLAALNGHSQLVDILLNRQRCTERERVQFDSILKQPDYLAFSEAVVTGDTDSGKLVWEVDERYSAERNLQDLLSCSQEFTDVSRQDFRGRTPLHLAANNGSAAILQLLLDAGASTETYDHKGLTALQLAVQNGQLRAVKSILSTGADPKAGAENWSTVIGQAVDRGHHSVANLMLWLLYSTTISTKPIRWSILYLAVDNEQKIAAEILQKTKTKSKNLLRSSLPLRVQPKRRGS
ncbi:hypothetical protein ACLMJK_000555 [Lecanora helva]